MSEWINVKDKLLKPYSNVLLLDYWTGKYYIGFCKPCCSLKAYWYSEDNIWIRNVTHWQPLPKQPKE